MTSLNNAGQLPGGSYGDQTVLKGGKATLFDLVPCNRIVSVVFRVGPLWPM